MSDKRMLRRQKSNLILNPNLNYPNVSSSEPIPIIP